MVKTKTVTGLFFIGFLVLSVFIDVPEASEKINEKSFSREQNHEHHLANIKQLTVGGKNAEAYFSFDGDRLIFQSTKDPASQTFLDCYQIYVMDLKGKNAYRVSTGYGGTTCGYFFPGGRRVLFSSTHAADLKCPPKPERSYLEVFE